MRRWLQSKKGAELIYKYPILLDACANEMARVGDKMMVRWAEVNTLPYTYDHYLRSSYDAASARG